MQTFAKQQVRNARKKNQQEFVFPNIYTSGKKPGKMSRQTDHTFKFKYKFQMFQLAPNTH